MPLVLELAPLLLVLEVAPLLLVLVLAVLPLLEPLLEVLGCPELLPPLEGLPPPLEVPPRLEELLALLPLLDVALPDAAGVAPPPASSSTDAPLTLASSGAGLGLAPP